MPFISKYENIVFKRPFIVIALFALIAILLSPYASNFRLDASSDSLVLENDASLRYFREEVSKYSTADLLVLTYAPAGDLFSDESLNKLNSLREKLIALDGVDSIERALGERHLHEVGLDRFHLAEDPLTSGQGVAAVDLELIDGHCLHVGTSEARNVARRPSDTAAAVQDVGTLVH